MANRDLALNPQTNDLDISNFDLRITEGLEAIAQRLRVRLRIFLKSYVYNRNFGVPYRDVVFQKNVNLTQLEAAFKVEILAVEGINELLEFNLDFDNANRNLLLNFRANTDEGILDFNETV